MTWKRKRTTFLLRRMPLELHLQFKTLCAVRGMSMNRRMLQLIRADLAQQTEIRKLIQEERRREASRRINATEDTS